MSRASSVEEIRERLAELPKTPWRESEGVFTPADGGGMVLQVPHVEKGGVMEFTHIRRFVRHAPTDIAYLLEIAEASREVVEADEGHGNPVDHSEAVAEPIQRLRDALEPDDA